MLMENLTVKKRKKPLLRDLPKGVKIEPHNQSVYGDDCFYIETSESDELGLAPADLDMEEVEMSCGSIMINGIDGNTRDITDICRHHKFTKEQIYNILYLSIAAFVKRVKAYHKKAFVLMSTTKKADKLLLEALGELCMSSTPWVKNPNSSNHIKIWTL